MAGGFTIDEIKLKNLKDFLKKKFLKIEKNLNKKNILFFDAKISPSALNESFFSEINSLSPFGSGNPEPKFVIEKFRIIKILSRGKQTY